MVFLCSRLGGGGGVQNDLDATLGPRQNKARGSGTAAVVAAVSPWFRPSCEGTPGAGIHHGVTHLSSIKTL